MTCGRLIDQRPDLLLSCRQLSTLVIVERPSTAPGRPREDVHTPVCWSAPRLTSATEDAHGSDQFRRRGHLSLLVYDRPHGRPGSGPAIHRCAGPGRRTSLRVCADSTSLFWISCGRGVQRAWLSSSAAFLAAPQKGRLQLAGIGSGSNRSSAAAGGARSGCKVATERGAGDLRA